MSEKRIIFEKADADMFMHFFKRIEEVQSELKNIIVKNNDDFLELAFTTKKNGKAVNKIEEFLAQTILVFYKSNYIYDNIYLPNELMAYKSILAKSLAVFDRASEIEEIKELIAPFDTLFVESFYIFKLKSFRARWDEICTLFLENIDNMLIQDSFIELIRYLIESTESGENEVYIHETPNQVFLLNADGLNLTDPIKKSTTYVAEVISELILLAPKGIILKCSSGIDQELIRPLVELFQEKVVVNAWQV